MSQQLAKGEPSSSQAHIKNIALVGAGGNMGSHILTALLQTGKHHITILTRPDSTHTFPSHPSITLTQIDYTSPTSLTSALTGHDALIITMGVFAPPDQEPALIRAASAAGVQYVFPNQWGLDLDNATLAKDSLMGPKAQEMRSLLAELGLKWLVVTSGFWYEYSLAGSEIRYGFDFNGRKVTFYNDGRERINTSTWEQVARAVAGLVKLPMTKSEAEGEGLVLEGFVNKQTYVSSFLVSQRDMFESVLRVTGTTEGEWEIEYEDARKRWERGVEMFKQGDRRGFGMAMYARYFFPDGSGDYETTRGLSNGVLGLPKEDFDACTKKAVERAEKLAGTY